MDSCIHCLELKADVRVKWIKKYQKTAETYLFEDKLS